jgi:hypothetical protein
MSTAYIDAAYLAAGLTEARGELGAEPGILAALPNSPAREAPKPSEAIGGQPGEARPSETHRFTAAVPTEPTFMSIDPDRPSVPAPVPMGPISKGHRTIDRRL